jgi:hypothetical protein
MAVSFRVLGRNKQPMIVDAASLRELPDVDDALWVATAAPVDTLRADRVFLSLLDTDSDGRIRSDELRSAIRWTFATFADPSGIREGNETLQVASLSAEGDGPAVKEAARRVALASGATSADSVTLTQVRSVRADEEKRGMSSAGRILPVAAGDDAALGALLKRAIEVTGGVPHPAGEPALDTASLDAFLTQGKDWLAWFDEGAVPASGSSAIRPSGQGTAAAHAALEALAPKLAQYFLLCDAIRLDADLAARTKVDASATDLLDPAAATALLARAPLAPPRADGLLDLNGPLNPAWSDAVHTLRSAAVGPLLGDRTTLDRAAITELHTRLTPWKEWVAREPVTKAGSNGPDALRTELADVARQARIRALIAESEVAAVVLDGVKLLEKAILMQAWLIPLANSFAAMPDLYHPTREGLVEQGVLVMDGRRFEFCLKVTDAGRAEKFAASSPMFVMFVMVGEKGSNWEYQVAVPVTAGEREHLTEGIWGVFYDRDGRELHAQIRKIAVSPISIKEAVLSPFRRIGDAVQGMFDKAAAGQQEAMSSKTTGVAQGAVDQATAAPTQLAATGAAASSAPPAAAATAAPGAPAAAAPGIGGQLPMLMAGAGIALAAVSSALAYVLDVFWSGAASISGAITGLPLISALGPAAESVVHILAFPLAVVILVLGVVLIPALIYLIPVVIATWLRLRRRDIATLLEGSGWAINTRLYLDRPLALLLTHKPAPPSALPIPKV